MRYGSARLVWWWDKESRKYYKVEILCVLELSVLVLHNGVTRSVDDADLFRYVSEVAA